MDKIVRIERLRRQHVIVDAAMLVPDDDKQGRVPHRRMAQAFVHVGDEHVAERHVVRRMLIVGLEREEIEVSRLDERVRRQQARLAVAVKALAKDLKFCLNLRLRSLANVRACGMS